MCVCVWVRGGGALAAAIELFVYLMCGAWRHECSAVVIYQRKYGHFFVVVVLVRYTGGNTERENKHNRHNARIYKCLLTHSLLLRCCYCCCIMLVLLLLFVYAYLYVLVLYVCICIHTCCLMPEVLGHKC